jgi:hypothetical protein
VNAPRANQSTRVTSPACQPDEPGSEAVPRIVPSGAQWLRSHRVPGAKMG